MTMTGNFDVEKEFVRGKMQRRLESLNADEVLSPSLKELAIKVSLKAGNFRHNPRHSIRKLILTP